MNSFGARLKTLRGNTSGKAFAAKLGVNRQTLYRYERGERIPDIGFIQSVSSITGTSAQWLISGEGMPPPDLRVPRVEDAASPPGFTATHDVERQLVRLKQAAGVLTDTAFAARLGITQGGISSAKKRGSLPDKWFVKIAKECGVPLEWLINGCQPPGTTEPPATISPAYHAAKPQAVPVLGLAPCGVPGWFNPGPLAVRVALPVDYPASAGIIAVIAVGAAMYPDGIRQGNLIFCDPSVPPENGDAVYIEQADGTASIKRFLKEDEEWVHLHGWGAPDEAGRQKPYPEKLARGTIRRLACVVIIKRKA